MSAASFSTDDDLMVMLAAELIDIASEAVEAARNVLNEVQDARSTARASLTSPLASNDSLYPLDSGRSWSLPRIGKAGQKGTRILLRLMDEPDKFISHAALAEAAEVRSPKTDTVKVYVCQVRQTLEDEGYGSDLIETGLHSYRVRTKNLEILIEFIASR